MNYYYLFFLGVILEARSWGHFRPLKSRCCKAAQKWPFFGLRCAPKMHLFGDRPENLPKRPNLQNFCKKAEKLPLLCSISAKSRNTAKPARSGKYERSECKSVICPKFTIFVVSTEGRWNSHAEGVCAKRKSARRAERIGSPEGRRAEGPRRAKRDRAPQARRPKGDSAAKRQCPKGTMLQIREAGERSERRREAPRRPKADCAAGASPEGRQWREAPSRPKAWEVSSPVKVFLQESRV